MEAENRRKRRRYGAELKEQILAECDRPGASVAKVAMAHGINANIVHSGRKFWPRDGGGTLSLSRAQFDALVLGLPWQRIGEVGVITLL